MEPTENGTIVCTGHRHPFRFWERDDEVAREAGWPKPQWWWDAADDEAEPVDWAHICGQGNVMLCEFTEIPTP